MITASTLIGADDPAGVYDLWEPIVFIEHDWGSTGFRMGSLWPTAISGAQSVAEQRQSLASRPRRSITVEALALTQDESARLLNTRMRAARARSLWPIYSDVAKIDSAIDCAGNYFGGDFANKRFRAGGWVVAVKSSSSELVREDFKLAKIVLVDDTTIILDRAIGQVCGLVPTIIAEGSHQFSTAGATIPVDIPSTDANTMLLVWVFNATNQFAPSTVTWNGVSLPLVGSVSYSTLAHGRLHRLAPPATSGTQNLVVTTGAGRNHSVLWQVVTNVDIAASPITYDAASNQLATPGGTISVSLTASPPATKIISGHGVRENNGTLTAGNGDETIRAVSGIAPFMVQTKLVDPASPTAYPMSCTTNIVANSGAVSIAYGMRSPVGAPPSIPYDLLYPLLECDASLDVPGDALTDYTTTSRLDLFETAGESAIPSQIARGMMPRMAQSVDGLPVLPFPVEWSESPRMDIQRSGSRLPSGTGFLYDVYGSRARLRASLRFLALNRHDALTIVEFFDSRAGSAFPFWCLSPTTEYRLTLIDVSGGNDQVRVAATSSVYDWNWRPWIAFVRTDGTVEIKKIASVARAFGEDILTLEDGNPPNETYDRVCLVIKARFDTDEMQENWLTATVMETNLDVIEVLEEAPVVIEPEDVCLGGDSEGEWELDPSYDLCEVRCIGTTCNICIGIVKVEIKKFVYCATCDDPQPCKLWYTCKATMNPGDASCLTGPKRVQWTNAFGTIYLNVDTGIWSTLPALTCPYPDSIYDCRTTPDGVGGYTSPDSCPDCPPFFLCIAGGIGCAGSTPPKVESCSGVTSYRCCQGSYVVDYEVKLVPT